jgi:hypothetical protein
MKIEYQVSKEKYLEMFVNFIKRQLFIRTLIILVLLLIFNLIVYNGSLYQILNYVINAIILVFIFYIRPLKIKKNEFVIMIENDQSISENITISIINQGILLNTNSISKIWEFNSIKKIAKSMENVVITFKSDELFIIPMLEDKLKFSEFYKLLRTSYQLSRKT